MDLTIWQDVGLLGLFIVSFFIYGFFGSYSVKMRFKPSRFISPTALFCAALVLAIDAVIALTQGRFVVAIAALLPLFMGVGEVRRSLNSARSNYLSDKKNRPPTVSWITTFWDGFTKSMERYQQWQEQAEQRRLVAIEKARIIAQSELDAQQAAEKLQGNDPVTLTEES